MEISNEDLDGYSSETSNENSFSYSFYGNKLDKSNKGLEKGSNKESNKISDKSSDNIVNNYKLQKCLNKIKNETIVSSPPDPFVFFTQSTREKWVDDNSSPHCKDCKTVFRFYIRRHHCRFCTDLYCDTCTKYREKIPRIIKKIPTKSGKEEPIDYNTSVRLCKKCADFFISIHNLEKLFIIFSLLDLTLKDYRNIAKVCKQWNLISAFYISKFKDIQYKLPKNYTPDIKIYNEWEKKALWNNRFLVKGHSVWEVQVLRSLIDQPKKLAQAIHIYFPKIYNENVKDNKIFCWQRMCSRYCSKYLDEERAILLLDVLLADCKSYELNIVAQELVKIFDELCDKIFECYLPLILYKLILSGNKILKNYILIRSGKNIRIANICYWYFKNNSKLLLSEFVEKIPQTYFSIILRGENFVEFLRNGEDMTGNIISPVDPQLGEQIVDTKNIVIEQSATRPISIPLDKSEILYKPDDIRKDYIIICVIRLMERFLQLEGLNINLITYNIQPTSEKDGIIQKVPKCQTLYRISEKLKTSLINYMLVNNPNETVGNLRSRFTKSCAVYSVIAFLLSINDRNTDNLMLTEEGDFFHIDFAQILSQNTKPLKVSCIRITSQMLDALGGENTKEYEEFKELCCQTYDILRRHINTFVCILSLLPHFKSSSPTSPTLKEDQMMMEIIKRFCPGETYEDAVKNLKTRIDDSAHTSTYTNTKYHVIDLCHHYAKMGHNGSMSNLFTGAISGTYSNTKWVLSSLYNYLYSFT